MSKLKKFRKHFNTFVLTRAFFTALTGSAFLYLDTFGFSVPWLNTLLGIAFFSLLLCSGKTVWAASGFFMGIFWFWWIALSFNHYHMPWAVPFVIFFIGAGYGLIFWLIAWTAEKTVDSLPYAAFRRKETARQYRQKLLTPHSSLLTLTLKALGLFLLSYLHPFGFDWFKPELLFTESFLGIQKWQFALILLSIILVIRTKQPLFLCILLLAYRPLSTASVTLPPSIEIVTTHTPVAQKWNKALHAQQFHALFQTIDTAIKARKKMIILPESVFPVFINYDKDLMYRLKQKAHKITIVTGGLYWDGETPRNSTYIFTPDGKVRIANKVVLVPFGEANPLPDFLSDWVNHIFYDGAVDYKADTHVTDYTIDGVTYRNAICFEATSERLYAGNPRHMIVLSNNGWFTPSIEPTLQKLLLQYYSRKYGTTIYHAANMSSSCLIVQGIAYDLLDNP